MANNVMNPQFAILTVHVNGDGRVVRVMDPSGEVLTRENNPEFYHEEEKERNLEDARLCTENWCCWKLVAGKWRCVPC